MRRIAAVLLLIGCGKPEPATEVTVAPLPSTTASSASTAVATVTPSATATATATSTASPIAEDKCAPGQLNVPCVYQANGKCFVRKANCTDRPCTESAHAEVSCDVFAKAREATACDVVRVCRGISDEGCRVDTNCHPQMATCIEKSCAPKILAATTCSAVPLTCIK